MLFASFCFPYEFVFLYFQGISVITLSESCREGAAFFDGRKFLGCLSGQSFRMPLIWGTAGVVWPGGAGLVRCAFVLVGPRVLSGTCHHWSIMNFFGYVSGQSSFFIHRKGHFCNLAEDKDFRKK